MWKPGTSKPEVDNAITPNKGNSNGEMSLEESSPKPSSLSKKKLSGATMNMRFMKRKEETSNYDRKRKAAISSSSKSASVVPIQDDHMERENNQTGNKETYSKATMIDMYGMNASLIGRRSFGGFNPSMEEAWKNSKASAENRDIDPKKKISDEELLLRYKEIGRQRSQSRPIGNFNNKSKRQKQR